MDAVNILLLEDETGHVELMRRAFEQYSGQMRLTVANSVAQARKWYGHIHPDLVIADWVLPDGHGTEFLKGELSADGIPVVVMTSHGNEQVAVEAMKAGALDYVVKSPDTLADMPHIAERALREWGHIVERQRAEEERDRLMGRLQKQARRMQMLIDTVPEGVLLLDARCHVMLANPRADAHLKTLSDEPSAGPFTHLGDRLMDELLVPPPKGLWHTVSANGRDFQIIARAIDTAGDNHTGPSPNTEETGWVMLIRDVTEQHQVERRLQLQERLATVGQLAGGMAHDLNNIMAVITLYSALALRTPDVPVKVSDRIGTIAQQAQRAAELIQQVLDFSRQAVLKRGPMDLRVFLKEQVKLLQRTLPENIEVRLHSEEGGFLIKADPTRIQQVIMNLATNARDAMPEGGSLTIELEHLDFQCRDDAPLPEMAPGKWVLVSVKDTGSGIPPEVFPHIFDPFFTTKPPGLGTGLGLSQVYGIISQHEGHHNVLTSVGTGTTFIFYLPALTQSHPPNALPGTEKLIQGKGQTLLVVEDDADVRKSVVGSLELIGYKSLEAANGQEALLVFEQHAPQISMVLSDMVMPKMGGRALFHALRERDPALKMVLMTGHPLREGDIQVLMDQGLKEWIAKPPSLTTLAEVIAQVLQEE